MFQFCRLEDLIEHTYEHSTTLQDNYSYLCGQAEKLYVYSTCHYKYKYSIKQNDKNYLLLKVKVANISKISHKIKILE